MTTLLNLWLVTVAASCFLTAVFAIIDRIERKPSLFTYRTAIITVVAAPVVCYVLFNAFAQEFIEDQFDRLDAWASRG